MSRPARFVLPDGYQVKLFGSDLWSPRRVGTDGVLRVPEVHNLQGIPLGAVAFATEEEAVKWCYLDASGALPDILQVEKLPPSGANNLKTDVRNLRR